MAYENLDGVRSTELNYEASPPAMRTRDGQLWFATYAGALVIDPEHLRTDTNPPAVYIDRVLANRSDVKLGGELNLNPGDENLEIHYTAVSFRAPQRVRFRYRLDGLDPDWVDADIRRVAYYTNVPHGRYRFRVIACSSDGVWNETGATLDFTKRPHLWETAWFWGLVAGCIGLGFYTIHRARDTPSHESRGATGSAR